MNENRESKHAAQGIQHRKERKYNFAFTILDILAHMAVDIRGIMEMMTRGYPTTRLSKNKYAALHRGVRLRHEVVDSYIHDAREEQRFYGLLYRLQKEGLVRKKKIGRKSIWEITKKGILKKDFLLNKIVQRKSKPLPLGLVRRYEVEPSTTLKVVIFDISEKEKIKRVWLRAVLKNMGFALIQKSVWMGENELPKEFIDDLRRLNLLPHVKIFSVVKEGSLL